MKYSCKNVVKALLVSTSAMVLVSCAEENILPPAVQASSSIEETAVSTPEISQKFLEMAASHAGQLLQLAPELATSLGVSEEIGGEGYNARFGDYSPTANQEQVSLNDRFLQDLRSYDRAQLTGTAAVTYDVLKNAYESAAQRNGYIFGGATVLGSNAPYTITQLSGPHISIPQMMLTAHPLDSAQGIEDYLTRLASIDDVMGQVVESLQMDAANGVVPPYFALEGAANSSRGLISFAPAEHPLVATFAEKVEALDSLTAEEKQVAVQQAEALVSDEVYPAYTLLADSLEALVPQAGTDAGIWRIDGGDDFYQHALNSYGANGMTGEEVHQLGLSEVARISAEMDAILKGMRKLNGSVGERFATLAEDDGMVYPDTDEGRTILLAELRKQVEAINVLAPDWFGTIPPQGVEVRRIPIYEQDSAPGGYYSGPSLDGTRPGIYWINLKSTADWPKYTLKTLTYHEAVPGHHFQISLQQQVDDMPLIRNMLYYSEYGEGWALYAEKVAAEMGMYADDPLGDLGRLQSELFRAARLVVDSGLHHKRWTREEAIDYMVEATGETRAAVTREIERYSVWPGQATSYKLGMLRIEELRAQAESELGDAFDIRAFHDAVLLDGSMPLPVLEAKIKRWITEQKG